MEKRINNRSVSRNAAWIIGSRIVQAVITFLIGMLTARYLGPSNYGVIGYAASLVAFVSPIMYLGIWSILVQELVENDYEEGTIVGTSLVLNLISAPLCVIGIVAFTLVANRGETETILVCALYSTLLLFQAFEVVQYWFQAHLLSKYSSIVSLGAYITVSVYKVFLLVSEKSVLWFALSNALDYLIIAIGLYFFYHLKGGQKLNFSRTVAKRLLSKGKYYILSSMMVTIYAQTDRIMLKNYLNNEAVGYYNAAVTCSAITMFVFTAIIDSFRPVILQSKKGSDEEFERNMEKLYSLVFYLAFLQSLFVTAFARLFIRFIYGVQYLPAVATLRIVVWYTIFSYIGLVRDIWILAQDKQRYLWRINLSGAVCNIILNSLLIPRWGINGAAVASLTSQFFTNIVMGYCIRDIRSNNELIVKSLNPRLFFSTVKSFKLK